MNPRVVESVRITAGHHALAGQVVRVVRRKRHRGEAYVVVEVQDGSRQLIAVRNTELSDGHSSLPDHRFTPGSLRALVDMINDCHRGAEHEVGDTVARSDQPPSVDISSARHLPASREALDGIAATPLEAGRHRRSRRAKP
jgi:hypothetical protein